MSERDEKHTFSPAGGQPAPDGELIRLAGVIERIIYSNEENGYTVCDLGLEGDDDVITATGILPYAGEGDSLLLWGRWVHSPKYGRQFRIEQYERSMPADSTAILRYLSSRTIKGIGPVLAQRIVNEYGDDTLDVLENHPDWLTQISGVSAKKAAAIGEDFRAKAGIRSAMMFFREYFGAALTVRIYKTLGSGAVDIAKNNPYRLCDEVEGIGFEKADRMAMQLGLDPGSDERLMTGVRYLLSSNAAQNGHVCLPREKLVAAAAQMLHADEARIAEAVAAQIAAGNLISRRYDGREYLFDVREDRAEQFIADKLILLDKLSPVVDAGDVDAFIRREEAETGMTYASGQRRAIHDALAHGVMILTGGPGTGKTTVVHALLHIFKDMGMSIALAAPTGRAAKRLSESTACAARTIHRLLEMEFGEGDGKGGRGHFRRNEQDLLDEDVVIIDETSMVDNSLMCSLLKAVKPGARLILIGDADQLPSVGSGRVLNDLIDSGRFATVRLDEIFRQAQQSLIVTNAHAVNEGRMPVLTVKDNDFFFLSRRSDAEIASTVVELYGTRLPRTYGRLTENGIQVITPSRKGEAGTENLNRLLQAALNPPARGKAELKYRDTVFRVGDRVMQTRNNYEVEWLDEDDAPDSPAGQKSWLSAAIEESTARPGRGRRGADADDARKGRGRKAERYDEDEWSDDDGAERSTMGIFNGDIGIVTGVDARENELNVRFDDRTARITTDMLDDLEHAWAVTVHKSQGSEYPFVIIPMYGAPPMLLTRNLLYTAVTRAQRMVILVGRDDIVRTMVDNNRQSMRYTGLCGRLKQV